jgi:hypothetical protein
MMVLGDFLRCCIAPLQQRSKMACMFTGVNDCSRIVHGASSDLSGTELEVLIRAMTGEAYTPESLVLPRGINALCEDQALRTAVLASMLTLDEGGLAVRQVGGDPNRGIRIPGTSPDSQQRAVHSPGGSCHGGPAPAGTGKGKEPELRHKYNMRSGPNCKDDEERAILIRKDDEVRSIPICKDDKERAIPIRKDDEVSSIPICRNDEERAIPIHKDDEVCSFPIRRNDEEWEAATSPSSQDREEAGSRRLHHSDGSYIGELAPKRQKMRSQEAEQLPVPAIAGATPAAAGEARGGAAVFTAASITATSTAAPGSTTATIPAAAAGPTTTTSAAAAGPGEEVPPDTRGILLREEGNPDYAGRMGGARLHMSG